MEHAADPLWFTILLNKLLAHPVAAGLAAVGMEAEHPLALISDHVAMQVLVLLILFTTALILRRQLSVTKPGNFQQITEVVVQFMANMLEEMAGNGSRRYLALIGSLGLFVAACNVIGIIPGFGSPTTENTATTGCALVAFLYYHFHGVRVHGIFKYLKHFLGPVFAMSLIMVIVETVSHFARILSLSARLWANMNVSTQLEHVFAGLVPIGIPVIFMGLHLFVSLLQAYIFMLMPTVYLGAAVTEEH